MPPEPEKKAPSMIKDCDEVKRDRKREDSSKKSILRKSKS